VFHSAGHLASWAGECPGDDQSTRKRRALWTAKPQHFKRRAQGSRRKRPQTGQVRAIAAKHSISAACCHCCRQGVYTDRVGDS